MEIKPPNTQFYYRHSKKQILQGCLCFTMKWLHQNHFAKIFLPVNAVGINGMRTALSPS